MFAEALQYPFFQRALIVGLLASIACGIIGTYVVVKKMSSFSGGLAHAVFGGIGMGHYYGFSPTMGALGFGLFSAMTMGFVYRFGEKALDTLISIIWSLGMAIGVIFIALTPGYAPDLNSYLFGSILFVPEWYLILVAALDLVILAVVVALFNELQALTFDEEFSDVVGVPVLRLLILLLVMIALAIIALIKVVGIILTIALLTLPAVVAKQWSNSLIKMMVFAFLLSAISTSSGLFFSYWLSEAQGLNVPSGPIVIILLSVIFAWSCLLKKFIKQ